MVVILTLFSRSYKHFEMSNFDQNMVSACYLLNRTMNSGQMEMFLALLPMVYIFLSLFVLLECALMLMT